MSLELKKIRRKKKDNAAYKHLLQHPIYLKSPPYVSVLQPGECLKKYDVSTRKITFPYWDAFADTISYVDRAI